MRPSSVSSRACQAGPSGLPVTQRANSSLGIRPPVSRLYSESTCAFWPSESGARVIRMLSIEPDLLEKTRRVVAAERRAEKLIGAHPLLGVAAAGRGAFPEDPVD